MHVERNSMIVSVWLLILSIAGINCWIVPVDKESRHMLRMFWQTQVNFHSHAHEPSVYMHAGNDTNIWDA